MIDPNLHETGRSVFLLQHAHPVDDGEEDVKLIGCYSTEAAADQAVQRLRHLPGFATYPNGFTIDRYEVDQDHWTEGFVSVRPSDA